MNQNNSLFDQKESGRAKHKNGVGQKTGWANKLGGLNTKLGGPVPGRPTCSAATGRGE